MSGDRTSAPEVWAAVRAVRMPRLVLWWVMVVATYAGLCWTHTPAHVEEAWRAVWWWRTGPPAIQTGPENAGPAAWGGVGLGVNFDPALLCPDWPSAWQVAGIVQVGVGRGLAGFGPHYRTQMADEPSSILASGSALPGECREGNSWRAVWAHVVDTSHRPVSSVARASASLSRAAMLAPITRRPASMSVRYERGQPVSRASANFERLAASRAAVSSSARMLRLSISAPGHPMRWVDPARLFDLLREAPGGCEIEVGARMPVIPAALVDAGDQPTRVAHPALHAVDLHLVSPWVDDESIGNVRMSCNKYVFPCEAR